MSSPRRRGADRIRAWLTRWGPLLPILGAEFIVMVGFGALLPVLPLYVQEQGIDAATLGVIIAAWPIAKLVSEPVFGWWADRHSRKPQMVVGLVLLGAANTLLLFFSAAVALFALRFVAGAATGLYDPAARGMIVDATEEDERGEAFGFYGAFQIGGFAVGPVVGAFGTAWFGGYAFPFFFTGALALVGALVILVYVPRRPHVIEDARFAHDSAALPLPSGVPFAASEAAGITKEAPSEPGREVQAPAHAGREREALHRPLQAPLRPLQAPLRALANRPLLAALVLAFGLHLSFGTYEVIWSLYLIALGATITWVGVTFVLFAVPEMIAAPIAGRLVDRKGPIRFVVGSGIVIIVSGIVYAAAWEPILPSVIVPIEAAATAVMTPALFSMVARGTPAGRSSTAQGIYGAVSTLALVVASLVAGALFEEGLAYPFWFFVVGMAVCLAIGLLVYRRAPAPTAASSVPTAEAAG